MSYKIVVDSCCELPEELKGDPRFEIGGIPEKSGGMPHMPPFFLSIS